MKARAFMEVIRPDRHNLFNHRRCRPHRGRGRFLAKWIVSGCAVIQDLFARDPRRSARAVCTVWPLGNGMYTS